MKMLLLIGIQTDLLPGGAREVPGSDTLIHVVNKVLPLFDQVIAANFSLPANHLTFAANHPWRLPGHCIEVEGQLISLRSMYCVSGSFGAEFAPGLIARDIYPVFEMGAEEDGIPHSAFFDAGNPKSTGLKKFLKNKGVKKLFISGMPLEEQVEATAIEALDMGIEVALITDACRAQDQSEIETVLTSLKKAGVQLTQTLELAGN